MTVSSRHEVARRFGMLHSTPRRTHRHMCTPRDMVVPLYCAPCRNGIVHAEKHKVDAAELRRKLQELQRSTEQLKKDKGLRHEEL